MAGVAASSSSSPRRICGAGVGESLALWLAGASAIVGGAGQARRQHPETRSAARYQVISPNCDFLIAAVRSRFVAVNSGAARPRHRGRRHVRGAERGRRRLVKREQSGLQQSAPLLLPTGAAEGLGRERHQRPCGLAHQPRAGIGSRVPGLDRRLDGRGRSHPRTRSGSGPVTISSTQQPQLCLRGQW